MVRDEFNSLSALYRIQASDFEGIPHIQPESIVLKYEESALAEIPAVSVDKTVINTELAAGLAGKSFRLTRGIRYRLGEPKSELIRNQWIRSNRKGFLVITDRRVVFSGISNTISVGIDSLFGTRIFADAAQFGMIDDGRLTTIGFTDLIGAEYFGVVLSKVLNR